MSQQNNLLIALRYESINVEKAQEVLAYSYRTCEKIGVKDEYTAEEQVEFEALTSRFARLSDLLVQKAWRSLYLAELELDGTVRDRINRAEKKGLIDSADIFIELRLLRNYIAHEYDQTDVVKIYQEVLQQVPVLLDAAIRFQTYISATKLLN
jgi:hypothetical protein